MLSPKRRQPLAQQRNVIFQNTGRPSRTAVASDTACSLSAMCCQKATKIERCKQTVKYSSRTGPSLSAGCTVGPCPQAARSVPVRRLHGRSLAASCRVGPWPQAAAVLPRHCFRPCVNVWAVSCPVLRKNDCCLQYRMKLCRAVILQNLVCHCKVRVFKNGVLRKREGGTGGWRKLDNIELRVQLS